MTKEEFKILDECLRSNFEILLKKLDDVRIALDDLYNTFMNRFDRIELRLDAIIALTDSYDCQPTPHLH